MISTASFAEQGDGFDVSAEKRKTNKNFNIWFNLKIEVELDLKNK